MTPNPLDTIAILDFGGQYAHLIANRIRKLGVFTRIFLPNTPVEQLNSVEGIIFSGGPASVYDENVLEFNKDILDINIPILGICYGHQLLVQNFGGNVIQGTTKEYGISELEITENNSLLFKDIPKKSNVWMSHGDLVSKLPEGFIKTASTAHCEFAAIENVQKRIYGVQFHPEVNHSEYGDLILKNFIYNICRCKESWDIKSYYPQLSEKIIEIVGKRKVFLLVSGGVDSTVVFVLLNKVLGCDKVLGLHIDNGMMRQNESNKVFDFLQNNGMHNLHLCDASEEFLDALEGVVEPEEKRKIIGNVFLKVKDREMMRLSLDNREWMLAQGTIYPDTIESGGTKNSDLIKTHHNRVQAVLELQEKGLLLEPLADLYKDEVRILGKELDIPEEFIWRHPFPGPGLGVRLLCNNNQTNKDIPQIKGLKEAIDSFSLDAILLPIKSVGVQGDSRTYAHPLLIKNNLPWADLEKYSTNIINNFHQINRCVWLVNSVGNYDFEIIEQYCTKESLDILRTFDDICLQFLVENNLYSQIWQMPVVLLPIKVANKPCIVMRPINSSDAMTANFAKINQELLRESLWLKLKEAGLGALFYDITHKPPATIEWE